MYLYMYIDGAIKVSFFFLQQWIEQWTDSFINQDMLFFLFVKVHHYRIHIFLIMNQHHRNNLLIHTIDQ